MAAHYDQQDSHGSTALMWAAARGLDATVKVLVAGGASLDLRDDHGRTALLWAVGWGNEAAVKVLVATGASLDLRTGDSSTAIMWANFIHLANWQTLSNNFPNY